MPSGMPPGASHKPLTTRAIVGLLAQPQRLRVAAALILGATTPSAVAEAAGLSEEETAVALGRLMRAGLVRGIDGELRLDERAFGVAARAEAPKLGPDDFVDVEPGVAKVLRAFLVHGRLVSIPAPGRKRRVVLEYLAAAFEPGTRYSEEQVNAVLRVWHDDYAALRRYLVEESLLARDAGIYWRSGGWVDVL